MHIAMNIAGTVIAYGRKNQKSSIAGGAEIAEKSVS